MSMAPVTRKPGLMKKQKPAAMTRAQLLAALRAESDQFIAEAGRTGRAPVVTDGLLHDLAKAAAHCRAKTIAWRGVRFPLVCGWSLQVLDPQTKKTLVCTAGGLLC